MREFAFTITYDEGADEIMDVLMSAPEARSTALLCSMSESELWRLDRVTGPSEAVEQVRELVTSESYAGLSISNRTCERTKHSDVLRETARGCVVYTYYDEISHCDAVTIIVGRYLSGGVLFEVSRRTDTEHWRILMQDDEKVGMVYDTIGAKLRDGLSFQFEHLKTVTEPPMNPFASLSVQPEQRRVLEIAAEHGYYETPRQITLDEIARILEIPRSTASYRLRRAEAELVQEFLATGQ